MNLFRLTLAIALSSMALAQQKVHSELYTETVDGIRWTYTVSDGKASIGTYSSRAAIPASTTGAIVVPHTLGGYPVTSVGYYAFYYCSDLTSVTIPDSVTSVGYDAFIGCTNLASIVVNDANPVYDSRNNCNAIIHTASNELLVGCKNTTIPNSVTSIRDNAFEDCTGLTSIAIPNSVTAIGPSAFSQCTGLTSINIPDSVTWMENNTFYGCSSLTSATIPYALSEDFFYNEFERLESVCLSISDLDAWCATLCRRQDEQQGFDSFLRVHPQCELHFLHNGLEVTELAIPSSVTRIGDYAFAGLRNITSIMVPNSVYYIDQYAFAGCTGLTSITLPDSVSYIGHCAFVGCTGLRSITMPDSLEGIREGAFAGCTGLTSITLPDSVSYIGHCAFVGCTGLTSITLPDNDHCPCIEEYAFAGCTGLTSITLPDRVSIDIGSFADCTGLTSLTLPNGDDFYMSSSYNFTCCTGLVSVIIPDGVTDAWSFVDALRGCVCIESFTVGTNNPAFSSENGLLLSKDGNRLFLGVTGGDVVIPDSVTDIDSNAFYYDISYWGDNYGCNLLRELSCLLPEDDLRLVGWNDLDDWELECAMESWWNNWRSTRRTLVAPLHLRDKIRDVYVPDWFTVVFHGFCDLTVSSAYGTTTPGVGRTTFEVTGMTNVTCRVSGVEAGEEQGVRYVCTGWTGTGSVPASGSGTNVTFELTSDSTLVWMWETNVWIDCEILGDACAAHVTEWATLGASLEIPFAAAEGVGLIYCTVEGDAEGVEVDASTHTIAIPVTRPRTLKLRFVAAETVVGTGGESLGWRFSDWRTASDDDASDGVCLRSGEVAASETSSIEAAIVGPGTLSFDWRVSANRGDYCRLYIDGVLQKSITRSPLWATVTIGVPSGEHIVRWSYERGSASAAGEDAAFLDNVDWQPLTLTGALDAEELVWTTDGAAWLPQVAVSYDGVDAAQSGQVIGDDVSGLETTLTGPGTLSWSWRLDSAGNASVDVFLDGQWLSAYEPTGEWTAETLEIGEGEHTVRFEFWNAGTAATITDCAYLDQVSWVPAVSADPIPALAADATPSAVTNAIENAGFADEAGVMAAIGGSATNYIAFKTWAQGVAGGEEAVVASDHAAVSWLLGAEALFTQEPDIRIASFALADAGEMGNGERGTACAMSVTVVVKDGEEIALVDAEKVASMFEATSDLGDWNGAAKLTPSVTSATRNPDGTMTFTVVPGDGTATSAFLRIKVALP